MRIIWALIGALGFLMNAFAMNAAAADAGQVEEGKQIYQYLVLELPWRRSGQAGHAGFGG